ncbi:hypothetical protein D3C72_1954940 [compost metagenome]
MGNGFVIEPHQLSAARFVPFHLDFRNGNDAFILLFAAGKVFILRVPAHRFPDNRDSFKHTAAEYFTLLLWHG